MKTVTLTIDDDVFRTATELAEKRGMSVEQLMTDHLAGISGGAEATPQRDRAQFRQRIDDIADRGGMQIGDRLPTREQTYEDR